LDKINNQSITSPEPCIAFRVDLPDVDYSLVPEGEEGVKDRLGDQRGGGSEWEPIKILLEGD
jgi:hypothetical protein